MTAKAKDTTAERLTVDKTLKFKDNPRTITGDQFDLLKKHLETLGDLSGVVYCTKNKAYVGGNQRSDVMDGCEIEIVERFDRPTPQKTLAHGFIHYNGEKFAYREVAFSKKEFRQACIVANSNGGDWDWEVLGSESWSSEPLSDWGLETPEGWGASEPVEEDEAAVGGMIDKAAELNKKWQVKAGDLWVIGEHRLVCGDSTSPQDVLSVLDGAKPNLMVTDPPYGVDYEPEWRNEAAEKGSIGYAASSIAVPLNDDRIDWTAAYQLFEGNVVYCWHADRHASEVQATLELAGFEIRSQIIWAKPIFAISRGHYHWQHEPCWYAFRKGESANWIGDHSQTTLWNINRDESAEGGHSTQKPLECMARPIRNHAGDVYEPFAGSGTTLVACQNLNRKCYAIEISENYCAVILERLSNLGLEPKLIKNISKQ